MSSVLVLLSGGMDSVLALHWARHLWHDKVEAVAVHYGQRHYPELSVAYDVTKALGVPFEIVEMSAFSSVAVSRLTGRIDGSDVVPARNAFLLSVAGAVALSRGIRGIVIGCNADDAEAFPDCREPFLSAMGNALRLSSGKDIQIIAPWLDMSKGEALEDCKHITGAIEHAKYSISCYEGRRPGCGRCSACVKRAAAFAYAGIEDAQ